MATGTNVGLIGLGIMGGAIAPNLIAAGFRVVGFDPNPQRCAALREAGAEIADSASAVAVAAHSVICSLPGDQALCETVRAIVDSTAKDCTIIETSTLALEAKLAAQKALSGAGHIMLDCPLSGTGAQARNKDLTVYASGDSAAIAAAAPIFDGFAKVRFDLGDFGNGSKMKYVANLLVSVHNLAAAEALVLGMKAGLDPAKIVEVVRVGAGGSRMLEVRGPVMASGSYDVVTAGFPLFHKDLGVIGQFAASLNCPTPLMNACLPFYVAGATAYPDCDVAALCGVLEGMAGHKRDN
jgi:L-threonate 2-dehydrogenase